MTTIGPPVESEADATADIGTIWQTAINRYEESARVKIESLAGASSVDVILDDIREQETKFKGYRHDGSRLAKFRTLVARSLGPIEKVGDIVASAASLSFPPSTAIFTASANVVSADYDKVVAFFEDLNLYLNRLKILEGEIPPVAELRLAVAQVLTSVLILCGICAKYVKTRRLVKSFRSLVSGEDDDLKNAYADFHKMVAQEEGAVRNATLASVVQLRRKTNSVQAGVDTVLTTTTQTDRNTRALMGSTGRIYEHLEGREAALERTEILNELSSLNFHNKQRDVFEKHHQGTGQWLLKTNEFQQWLRNDRNSMLWCPGIPGAGKTVMTSIVVNHVAQLTQGERVAIAYIYCDYKDAKTQSEVELLCSVVRQLAEQTSPLPPELKAFRDQSTQARRNPTDNERISLLRSICLLFQNTYLFIDALVISRLTD
ncbi:MAG: hypothetical protein L6R39_003369 [Caloplaca ligustica]|nr:MAG: hypothetical protein L6R39_003369 [Caloplaca ligustica]